MLQPSSMKDPPRGTDPTNPTASGPDHQQPQAQSNNKADAGFDQKAAQYEDAEDHKSVVAPSAESIRQGIMEASPGCDNTLPLQPFVSFWPDTVSSTHVQFRHCHDCVELNLQRCPCCMHDSGMAGSGAHPVHRMWLYLVLWYAGYAVYAVLYALQETQPGKHGLVHDHAVPFTSINSLRPSILKVTRLNQTSAVTLKVCVVLHACTPGTVGARASA